ncbi:MAG: HD domain-containing protein [Candidatus Zixiibacteriota bacterium]|nr:MAG: HD domain-containing protein [candidate division Zixibacteria bacterium]
MLNNSINELKDKNELIEALLDEQGRHLVNLLHATFKVAGMYEANNNRYIEQASKLRGILKQIFDDEADFSLAIKGGYMYLNGVRLKADRESEVAMTYFLERWPELGISGLTLTSGLDPRELDKFIFFMTGFESGENREENYDAIKSRLIELGIENIIPSRYSQEAEEPEDADKYRAIRAKAKKTFFSAVSVVHNTMNQAKSQNSVNIAKTKRVVQQLIDVIIEDESALMEMTALRSFDDYTYVHSVNVCVLSLILGHNLGLDRKRLSNLGVGALIHDIGKTKLPIDLVNKPDSYDEYDWELMRRHPIYGVKFLLKTRSVEETTARATSAVYEHHISYDGAGYPQLLKKRIPTLFARIVAVADTYNAMSSGRVYHRKKNLPDEVITNMANRAGSSFDPILLKVFINALGIYPVGTVVALSSNQVGIVTRSNPKDPENPKVKIVADESGLLELDQVKVIDLSKESGINVTRIIDGDKYNINNANYLDKF